MAANQRRGFREILDCDWLYSKMGQGGRRSLLVDIDVKVKPNYRPHLITLALQHNAAIMLDEVL